MQKDLAMPLVKIKTKGQITIPKKVRDQLDLAEGDWIEVNVKNGQGVIMPTKFVTPAPTPKLTAKEQHALRRAEKKMHAINTDVLHSKGLTKEEADAAAKAGLIDPDQKYWWLEAWQKRHRQAERDDKEGNYEEFDTPEAFLNSLRS